MNYDWESIWVKAMAAVTAIILVCAAIIMIKAVTDYVALDKSFFGEQTNVYNINMLFDNPK